VESAESSRRIAAALATLSQEVRLAVQLFVVEQVPAATIAGILGWPGPKTVYNRVYRGLASLREHLQRDGIRREDLG